MCHCLLNLTWPLPDRHLQKRGSERTAHRKVSTKKWLTCIFPIKILWVLCRKYSFWSEVLFNWHLLFFSPQLFVPILWTLFFFFIIPKQEQLKVSAHSHTRNYFIYFLLGKRTVWSPAKVFQLYGLSFAICWLQTPNSSPRKWPTCIKPPIHAPYFCFVSRAARPRQ